MQVQTLAETPPDSRWTQGKYKALGASDSKCRVRICLAKLRPKILRTMKGKNVFQNVQQKIFRKINSAKKRYYDFTGNLLIKKKKAH